MATNSTTYPPPPPCTFTLTTVYTINCCTSLFNMSYSRNALKKYTVGTIKRNKKQDAREAMRVFFFLYSQNVFVCTKRNFL